MYNISVTSPEKYLKTTKTKPYITSHLKFEANDNN
jgi:hypothetical protein